MSSLARMSSSAAPPPQLMTPLWMQIDLTSASLSIARLLQGKTGGLPHLARRTGGNGGIVGSLQTVPPPVHRKVVEPLTEVNFTIWPPHTVVPVTLRLPSAVTSRVPPGPPKARVLEAISSDAVTVTGQPASVHLMST